MLQNLNQGRAKALPPEEFWVKDLQTNKVVFFILNAKCMYVLKCIYVLKYFKIVENTFCRGLKMYVLMFYIN